MNKKLIGILPLMAILLVGTVLAGITAGTKDVDKDIPEAEYNALKTYLADKQNVAERDVKMDIAISDCIVYDEDHCKYSAVLKDVISSHDIVLNLKYCSKVNETTQKCLTYTAYTDKELSDQQDAYVASRVEGFAKTRLINQVEPSVKAIGGNLTVTKGAVEVQL